MSTPAALIFPERERVQCFPRPEADIACTKRKCRGGKGEGKWGGGEGWGRGGYFAARRVPAERGSSLGLMLQHPG